ncbi:MAG: acyl-CoA dehydrogenase family protein [Deltaproteobacteria bacterium]|nr:acyl-CoA dehydrogenase family protein [Deltaproteobacteria bacterium]
MKNSIYSEEHRIFRDAFRKFIAREVAPHLGAWEEEGTVPRHMWTRMGEQGFLCPWVDEAYGGLSADFAYSIIINEELGKIGAQGFMVGLHSDIVAPYINSLGTEPQKKKWLPGAVTGEILMAVAMTEPNAGSDLQGIRTKAVKDGNNWVINGQKTFISLGENCDLVIVACITDPDAPNPSKGMSLIVVEDGTKGFSKGPRLKKMGMKMSDTNELIFEDCRVPLDHLLGTENMGFAYLIQQLQRERLICSIYAQTASEAMLEMTVKYCQEREAFGVPIGRLQHNTFKLAEMATEVDIGRNYLDSLLTRHMEKKAIMKEVSMAKWWLAETANRIAYTCVQLHGGYGYMEEYPICRWYRDVRVMAIFAGTTEIMKQIIGKKIGF